MKKPSSHGATGSTTTRETEETADSEQRNHVEQLRRDLLLSKAELARKAGVSPLTIDRIEAGKDCRLDTKRKIIQALGLKLVDRKKVFED